MFELLNVLKWVVNVITRHSFLLLKANIHANLSVLQCTDAKLFFTTVPFCQQYIHVAVLYLYLFSFNKFLKCTS
jgi:hypothetical protein